MIQETSSESYKQICDGNLSEKQQIVLDGFKKFGNKTDSEISKLLGFSDNNEERPRRFELAELGLICEKEKRLCEVSGRFCISWGIKTSEDENKKDIGCLTTNEYDKAIKLLNRANFFQKKKIMEFLNEQI